MAAALPPAAQALFKVRCKAARGDLAAALHARDLLQRRRRVRLPKHIRRAARAGRGVERAGRRRGRRLGGGREPQLGLAVRLYGDLGAG